MSKAELAYAIAKKYKLNEELVMEIPIYELEEIFWNGWDAGRIGIKKAHYK